jgi:mycothiol synthase
MSPDYDIQPFDPDSAPSADFEALYAFGKVMLAEFWPDDPVPSPERHARDYRYIVPFSEVHRWLARSRGDRVVAEARYEFTKLDHNRHLGSFWIGVLPDNRRRGLAKALLARIAEEAGNQRRPLLMTNTTSAVPAGEAFMERLGATMGLATYTNQLDIRHLDRALLEAWLTPEPDTDAGFELGLWEGNFPESELQAVAELQAVMNGAPRDNLDMEDGTVTPEQVRQFEEVRRLRGNEQWTMYVRERATGRLAGYTEVRWHPELPSILQQGDTGVWPEYRNRGLGKWLKASMLTKVLTDLPQVRFVRTGNAQSNAPMLSINHRLGFRASRENKAWQVPLVRVVDYLQGRP